MRTPLRETRSNRLFDRLTRRAALMGGGAGLVALGVHRASAQDATPVDAAKSEATPAAGEPPSFLFIQHAGATTLAPGTGPVHTLTMTEALAQTLYFSDRPNRITGATPTEAFVSSFRAVFGDDPPNASLIGHLEPGAAEEEAVVLTLLSAAYDAAATTLTYEVQLLDAELIGNRSFEQEPLAELAATREYAEAHLFIDSVSGGDDICDPDDCLPDCSTNPAFYLARFQQCLPAPDNAPTHSQEQCDYCAEWMGCSGPVATQTDCGAVNYQCQKLPGYCL